MEQRKLAVLFPGTGYTCTKPLLYYTAQAAEAEGYEIIRLEYGETFRTFRGRTMEDLLPLIELALQRSAEQLAQVKWETYDKIIFISKSIGTVVSCRIAESCKVSATQFLMTPIPLTLPYLPQIQGCFVAGTADPNLAAPLVRELQEKYPEKTAGIFEGCNHSLEIKGDMEGNLGRILAVVKLLRQWL